MKKLLIIIICISMFILTTKVVNASTHQAFQELTSSSGKLVEEWSSKTYEDIIPKVNALKLSGWKYYYANKDFRVDFKSKTIFSYYNDGYTPIEYNYKNETKLSTKLHLSSTGTITIKSDSKKNIFNAGLSSTLKLEKKWEEVNDSKEIINVKLFVDPGTQVDLYILGSGLASNGIAAKYQFFSKINLGAFEYVQITSQYYRLEKVKI